MELLGELYKTPIVVLFARGNKLNFFKLSSMLWMFWNITVVIILNHRSANSLRQGKDNLD